MKKKEKLQEQGSKLKKMEKPCISELVKLSGKELALVSSSSKQESERLSNQILSGKPDLGRAGLSWLSSTPPSASSSNKRNLTATVAGTPKRLKLGDNEPEGVGGSFGVKGGSVPLSSAVAEVSCAEPLSKVSMELLLHAAGLEVQCKYKYHTLTWSQVAGI